MIEVGLAAVIGVAVAMAATLVLVALVVGGRRHAMKRNKPQYSEDGSATMEFGKLSPLLENITITNPVEPTLVQPGIKALHNISNLLQNKKQKLDPEDPDPEDKGKVHFGLSTDEDNESKIHLNLIELQLPGVAGNKDGNTSGVFLRASFLPDEKMVKRSKVLRRPTGFHQHGLSLSEVITFNGVSQKAVELKSLALHLVDADTQEVLGEVILPLKGVNMSNCPVYWKHFRESTQNVKGQMNMSLCWQPLVNSLKVTVNKAADLLGRDSQPDTFVKLVVLDKEAVLAQRKTTVRCQTSKPNYGETFAFDTSAVEMSNLRLRVTVTELGRATEIGEMTFGLTTENMEMYEHWLMMIVKPGEQVPMWHKLE